MVGMSASFMSTQRAPATPRSSAVTGSPALLLPITMRPNLMVHQHNDDDDDDYDYDKDGEAIIIG